MQSLHYKKTICSPGRKNIKQPTKDSLIDNINSFKINLLNK